MVAVGRWFTLLQDDLVDEVSAPVELAVHGAVATAHGLLVGATRVREGVAACHRTAVDSERPAVVTLPDARLPGHQGGVTQREVRAVSGGRRLQHITYWFHKGEPDPETGELVTEREMRDAIEARRPYAMKRKGDIGMTRKGVEPKEAGRGKQRFTYPDPRTYMAFDPATNKKVPHTKDELRGSVLVNPYAEVVRHLQRYPWGSPE
ncbi:hypothetical protein AB0O87_03435 [Microbacterium sp. NPDC076768]|uniref:hypothetical protein n=1 Tax=Microbacterium sp. NPDC076768 TaxID=3154858 RepID=UPI00341F3BA6